MTRTGLLCTGFGLALPLACATGVGETGSEGSDGGYGGGVGAGGIGGATTTTETGGFGGAEVGGGGAGGEGSGGEGGGTACDFTSPNSCSSAEAMPDVAGDQSGPTVTASGSTSKWFVVRIEEQVSSIFAENLSYTVSLQMPVSMDYDLYVLHGPDGGNPDCNATPQAGQALGSVEALSNGWNDDQGLGGEDDSVYLNIEVRYVSGGVCGPGNEWTLSVEGNT